MSGSFTPTKLGFVGEIMEAREFARNRDGTGGLGLPPLNCLEDGRVAIYCEGLAGAQAAGATRLT